MVLSLRRLNAQQARGGASSTSPTRSGSIASAAGPRPEPAAGQPSDPAAASSGAIGSGGDVGLFGFAGDEDPEPLAQPQPQGSSSSAASSRGAGNGWIQFLVGAPAPTPQQIAIRTAADTLSSCNHCYTTLHTTRCSKSKGCPNHGGTPYGKSNRGCVPLHFVNGATGKF